MVEIIHTVEIDMCMYKILVESKTMPVTTLARNRVLFTLQPVPGQR